MEERTNLRQTLAQTISDIGNPMIWGTFLFVLLMWVKGLALEHILLALAIFFATVGLVSAVTFAIARNRQFIRTKDLVEREIRSLPYVASMLAYFLAAAIFGRQNWAPKWIIFITSSMGVGLGICGVINAFWKISFHTFASSAMATMFFMVSANWWSLIFFAISLIIGWSRVKINVHTPKQVGAGFLLGIVVPLITKMTFLGGYL
ncbi:phosphatase PAP2 family protein [Coprothermobacter platensis]|jgi:membrane-associated phospholipid phosphatase|uniref:phosphatase PAP2 family protein n=1 Tax=Coprothermobacter platensis TaxID=108819 RepID=UPI0003804335|nr:phosphatase PAP2 family protein [Coprothermobacter platensis]